MGDSPFARWDATRNVQWQVPPGLSLRNSDLSEEADLQFCVVVEKGQLTSVHLSLLCFIFLAGETILCSHMQVSQMVPRTEPLPPTNYRKYISTGRWRLHQKSHTAPPAQFKTVLAIVHFLPILWVSNNASFYGFLFELWEFLKEPSFSECRNTSCPIPCPFGLVWAFVLRHQDCRTCEHKTLHVEDKMHRTMENKIFNWNLLLTRNFWNFSPRNQWPAGILCVSK